MKDALLKAGVEKFKHLHDKGHTKEEVLKELTEDVYSTTEALEVYEAILKAAPQGAKEPVKIEGRKLHPTLKMYDEFVVNIVKAMAYNALAKENESIILGWSLDKKLHPKAIEPSIAINLNSFASGYESGQPGKILLEEGSYQIGDTLDYAVWAKEQNINLKKDINHLLKDMV